MSGISTAWKFPLGFHPGPVELSLPRGARIVGVAADPDPRVHRVCVWAEVDPQAPTELRSFILAFTGDKVPASMEHVGMTVVGALVYHVWVLPAS